MEEIVLKTLKAMFTNPIPDPSTKPGDGFGRGRTGNFDSLGNPLPDSKMYTFDGILIVFSTKARVSESDLNNFIAFAEENNYRSGMIILSGSSASEKVEGVIHSYISNRENPLVQLFQMRHLHFDKSRHRLAPTHRVITDEERNAMMKEFNITNPKSIPKIDCIDPMAMWIGARPDDIVEIRGLCETSGENRRYRYCVSDVTNG